MSAEENKMVIRRVFLEAMNGNQPHLYDELIAEDYVNHDFPTPVPGIEGFKIVDGMFKAAFSDFQVVLEDEIAEGDRVATRGYFVGTHSGEFMGIPATGRRIKVGYVDVWRLEHGKGRENWVQMDMLGLLRQLGAMPSPEQATA
jgi:predicted ester cyclase